VGACCVDRGDGPVCVEVEKGVCKLGEGEWFGYGSICADVLEECLVVEEPELGACCVKDECIESTEDDCRDLFGDFFGPGSTCLDAVVTCHDGAGGGDDGGDDGDIPVGVDTTDDIADEVAGPLGCSTVAGSGGDGWGLLGLVLLGLVRRRRAA